MVARSYSRAGVRPASHRHRGPPSAGFLLFQGTLAKPNKCSRNRALRPYAPYMVGRSSDWQTTQCFTQTVPSKNILTIMDMGVPKIFFKKSVDGSRTFPYSTIQSGKGIIGCLARVGGKIWS